MQLALKDLRYVLFPAENHQLQWTDLYRAAYQCWTTVWSKTFQELEGNGNVFSDDFTRQSLIGAVMKGNRCIGMGFFRQLNFRLPTSRSDSYFKVWPDEAIQKLLEDGPNVLVGSNITVDPEFRGTLDPGIQLKHLILGLMVKTLAHWDVDVMTGTMRCNRGMHTSAYRFGGTPIQSGIIHHGVDVDLVAFYRRRLDKPGAAQSDLSVETLWRNRWELGSSQEIRKKRAA